MVVVPLVRGILSERRPGGSIGLGSSLLAMATRLRIVALHSSSFPIVGGKSRSNCTRARASAGVGGSETCTDRDALQLLTMSEGALSRPRGRSASASGQVFDVPGVALGALPVATPVIFGVIMPFVARCLGGARCWRRRGSLGGPCPASQTPAAGMVLVFASSAPSPFYDWSAARPHRDGLSGFRLANRHRRLLLGRHDDEEAPN